VRHYKPDPEVYDAAPHLLAVPPSSVVMVAAHVDDLVAARARGLRTAYVHRPGEFGERVVPPASDPEADWSVASFEELAGALGA
jgi:2-haloacid dehalogenase